MSPKTKKNSFASPGKDKPLRIGLRLVVLAALGFGLLIPALMIGILVQERKMRQAEVIAEVAEKWCGGIQHVSGPLISIPYMEMHKEDNRIIKTIMHANFLPDTLQVKGTLEPEVRYRGIFKVILYKAKLEISGTFSRPSLAELKVPEGSAYWEDCRLLIGVQNIKGIRDFKTVDWNGRALDIEAGVDNNPAIPYGVSARLPDVRKMKAGTFSCVLYLDGHDALYITPAGHETQVVLQSPWTDPSFKGDHLPATRRIDKSGFSAEWKVQSLNRGYPQQWIGVNHDFQNSGLGVGLYESVDHYQKVSRTLKYAVMFIFLTFLTLFVIEIMNLGRIRLMHPIQYLIVGAALVVFYTLLLALSEHIGFTAAYILATLGIVGMVAGYTRSLFSDLRFVLLVSGLLLALYSYLYFILNLEDYALLAGSLGLFTILALVMYLTRKVDWYNLSAAGTIGTQY